MNGKSGYIHKSSTKKWQNICDLQTGSSSPDCTVFLLFFDVIIITQWPFYSFEILIKL